MDLLLELVMAAQSIAPRVRDLKRVTSLADLATVDRARTISQTLLACLDQCLSFSESNVRRLIRER